MTTWADLQRVVAAAYDVQGLTSWPNPHPDMAAPADEEYSRVTEPERYRIVHVRAGVWRDVLADLPGVSVETVEPDPPEGGVTRFVGQRCVRVTSSVPGALGLVLLEQDVGLDSGEGVLPMLRIAVERPDLVLEAQPDCGCDACDSGSDGLLEAVDEAIRRVVEGPIVVLREEGWGADWSPERAGSYGLETGQAGPGMDHRAVSLLCERLAAGGDVRLPDRTEALTGSSWF